MRKVLFLIFSFFLSAVVFAESEVIDTLKAKKLDEVVISAIRAKKYTPVAHSTVQGEKLKQSSAINSLPSQLNNLTSIVAFTEGGTSVGNTSLRIRGTDATRINVTLNGMPLNNPETQEVFWANLPDLANSLQSVQIQRGVGSSTNGAAAFGASLSMSTQGGKPSAYGEASMAAGSYNTFLSNIAAGTGIFENGLSFDLRFSKVNSDGYIRNAKVDHQNLYAAISHYTDNQVLRLLYMRGEQHTGITWEGVTAEQMSDSEFGRRYNPTGEYYDEVGNRYYYDNETDNYYSDIIQLLYTRQLTNRLNLNANINWNKGFGYYENYKRGRKFSSFGLANQVIDNVEYKKSDVVRQKMMNNDFYVANISLNYTTSKVNMDFGAMYSYFDGHHYGKLPWIKIWDDATIDLESFEWYRNRGIKDEISAFAKATYNINSEWSVYADLQARALNYKMSGMDDDLADLDNNFNYKFFNPKFGTYYQLNTSNSLFFSISMGNREPLRADLKDSNKWNSHKSILPERMIDYEFGYSYQANNTQVAANIYYMDYYNQMVQTGKLTDAGYKLMENVDRSYRRGVEFETKQLLFNNKLDLLANLTLSQNIINNYTAYFDIYDENWDVIGQKTENLGNSQISYSPSVVGAFLIQYRPIQDIQIGLINKYVGKQYLDNTTSDDRSLPSYLTNDLQLSYNVPNFKLGSLTLQFIINNLLNKEYIANGYAEKSIMRDSAGTETSSSYIGYYPQAPRNFLAKLSLKF